MSPARSRKHGPRPGIEVFVVEGAEFVYRKPFLARDRWRVRRRRTATGEVEMVTLKSENLKEAKREVRDMAARERQDAEALAKTPEAAKPQDATVTEAMDKWVGSIDVRESTLREYRIDAKQFAKLLGASKLVRDIGFADVAKLFAEDWRALAGRTKLYRRGLMVRAWDYFVASGYTKANPVKAVTVQKAWTRAATKAARETGQALTVPEARRLLKAASEPVKVNCVPSAFRNANDELTEVVSPRHLWWFVFLSLRTGLRISNILGDGTKPGLLWRNLDLEEGTLSIEGSLMKNDCAFRVPLHREAVAELKKLQASLGRVPDPKERVIPGDATEVRRSFHAALRRAKLEDKVLDKKKLAGIFLGELRDEGNPRPLRIHDLRHSFISWLGDTVPDTPKQLLAGHLPVTVNDKYARHQEREKLRKWINELEPLLGEPTKKERLKKNATR